MLARCHRAAFLRHLALLLEIVGLSLDRLCIRVRIEVQVHPKDIAGDVIGTADGGELDVALAGVAPVALGARLGSAIAAIVGSASGLRRWHAIARAVRVLAEIDLDPMMRWRNARSPIIGRFFLHVKIPLPSSG